MFPFCFSDSAVSGSSSIGVALSVDGDSYNKKETINTIGECPFLDKHPIMLIKLGLFLTYHVWDAVNSFLLCVTSSSRIDRHKL